MNEDLYRQAWNRANREADMIMGQYKTLERGRPNKADIASRIFSDLLACHRDNLNNANLVAALTKALGGTVVAAPKTQAQIIEEQIEALKLQLSSGTVQ